jgi:hypothetical protein
VNEPNPNVNEFLVYLKDARQRSAATVDQARHAIDRFEVYIGFKDFGTFNKEPTGLRRNGQIPASSDKQMHGKRLRPPRSAPGNPLANLGRRGSFSVEP